MDYCWDLYWLNYWISKKHINSKITQNSRVLPYNNALWGSWMGAEESNLFVELFKDFILYLCFLVHLQPIFSISNFSQKSIDLKEIVKRWNIGLRKFLNWRKRKNIPNYTIYKIQSILEQIYSIQYIQRKEQNDWFKNN